MGDRIAYVFPGQGAYLPGLLAGLVDTYPAVLDLVREVDEVCAAYGHRPVSGLLLDRNAMQIEELLASEPEVLHLCVFTASIASAIINEAEGVRPDVLVGHSFGEWAAMTWAGVWSVKEAASLICERDRICRRVNPTPGGLIAVALSEKRASELATLVDEWSVNVATVNGPRQCVLAGPDAALGTAMRVADALGVQTVRIKAAYPYHSPLLRGAAEEFAAVMGRMPATAPSRRVYSPIARDYVTTVEIVRWLGAEHMTSSVHFLDALHALQGDGVDVFVECGAKDIVTRLVSAALPGVVTAAPLARRADAAAIRAVLSPLRASAPSENRQVQAVVATRSKETDSEVPPAEASVMQHDRIVPPMVTADSVLAVSNGTLPERTELVAILREAYATKLGYPLEVMTDDADLEADLGIDSLRQAEMISALYERYSLNGPAVSAAAGRRTLLDIADFLHEVAAPSESARTSSDATP